MLKYTLEINRMSLKNRKNISGFTLVEALVGAAIFLILALSVYQAYQATMDVIRLSRIKITATALANEQFEIMRNLPYTDIGIVNGLPWGKIPAVQNLIRDGKEFTVKTTIRNVDDPFDGTIGGTPNDTSPADYKLAELEITCSTCLNFPAMNLATNISPKALESASTNGAIFIKVFDSSGSPIANADIHIENNQTIPSFIIDDTTNNEGLLQIVDAPPSNEAYEITVSKNGYTTDQTYTVGDPENPTPDKPHATVLLQQLTQISFIIDQISKINITSLTDTCETVPAINFSLRNSKLIGTSPDVYKYNEELITDDNGIITISDLDGGTYELNFSDATFDLIGIIPSTSFILSPAETEDVKLIVTPHASTSLLIIVNDATTDLPLSGASVQLIGTDYNTTIMTTDGSACAGAGQVFFTGLENGSYNINILKDGYESHNNDVNISEPWQQYKANLNL